MGTPKPADWKGVHYDRISDMPPGEAAKYRIAHPTPKTQAKYYDFANAYINNGFNGAKAWKELNPQADDRTARQMAWYILTYNEGAKKLVSEAKKKMADAYDLDWCIVKLGQIADDDTVQPKDKITGIKAIQNQLMKMRELEAKEKTDNKDEIIKIELIGDESDEDAD